MEFVFNYFFKENLKLTIFAQLVVLKELYYLSNDTKIVIFGSKLTE